ncbi:hypothetical protein [Actinomadura sp. HBU206391]|uniref:hypothetical protein n=1 Tax=Actinomadura sp. HBU206391 TaxID=2731692 RepID=UPI00164EF1DB|nr:hypothetical protein [Actinomadura sp. HBU206391]MBC6458577.1 hypothetical protein [Actinomadura sp. HBU206391]
MSGSHRIPEGRPERRGMAFVLAGAAVGVIACGGVAAFVLNQVASPDEGKGLTSSDLTVESSPVPTRTDREAVPDACVLLPESLTRELVPEADRTQTDTFAATDAHNQCVWSRFGDQRLRQLTVELRAVPGAADRSSADVAHDTLDSEREADESGEGLPPGQKVSIKRGVDTIGDEGYLTYSVQSTQRRGEAVVNVRAGNVLITVHYAGGDSAKTPLSSKKAIDGATQAAEITVNALATR